MAMEEFSHLCVSCLVAKNGLSNSQKQTSKSEEADLFGDNRVNVKVSYGNSRCYAVSATTIYTHGGADDIKCLTVLQTVIFNPCDLTGHLRVLEQLPMKFNTMPTDMSVNLDFDIPFSVLSQTWTIII